MDMSETLFVSARRHRSVGTLLFSMINSTCMTTFRSFKGICMFTIPLGFWVPPMTITLRLLGSSMYRRTPNNAQKALYCASDIIDALFAPVSFLITSNLVWVVVHTCADTVYIGQLFMNSPSKTFIVGQRIVIHPRIVFHQSK